MRRNGTLATMADLHDDCLVNIMGFLSYEDNNECSLVGRSLLPCVAAAIEAGLSRMIRLLESRRFI